jgi:hypothetical protein
VDAGQRGLGGFLVSARGEGPAPCLAPICLFVHSRPGHTRRTLDALAANSLAAESTLIVRADGPRSPGEGARVEAVRALFRRETRFRRVELHEQDHNLGLARSVITGLDDLFRRYDTAIILEDDLVTSPHFLAFMNEGLQRYRDEPRVGAILGSHLGDRAAPGRFFSRLFLPWGWATWRRAWADFEPDGQKLAQRLKDLGLERAFNVEGTYNYYRMLQEQQLGLVDSWYIRWYASQFLQGHLALWPGQGLVDNIGRDGSGTHAREDAAYTGLGAAPRPELPAPEVRADQAGEALIQRFYRQRSGGRLAGWLKYHCPIALKAVLEGKVRKRP